MSAPTFVELSARSGFSLLDGACNPEDYAERATELGLPALALTDTFDLGGAVRFTRACEDTGVRPIIGAEVRIEFGALRLVLLCENTEGYHHLAALVNEARLAGDRGFPRLDLGHLRRDPEGLVCLLMGDAADPEVPAVSAALPPLREIFAGPDRLHVALEHHGLPADGRRCGRWIEFAHARDVPWVPVNAPRYARPRDRIVCDVLTCLKHGVTLDEAGDRLRPNAEWYLKGAETMAQRWAGMPGARTALARTAEIAGRCTFQLKRLAPRLPTFPVPGGRDPHGFLRGLVERGAEERYGERLATDPRHRRQIEHELSVIGRLDLADYFLIMWDIVRFANRRGILVQGRGSAANSVVCYCLGITAVDPIGYELLFERFLSESRDEPPDIDLDIAHEEREDVLQYVYGRYGREHAAMVCESITYRGKMAVRDAARVLGYPPRVSDRLSVEVDRGGAGDAAERLAAGGLAAAGLDPADPRARALLRAVRGLEDLPRHRSIHVGGFVLSDRPLGELVPIERASMADRTIIQWDKDDLELPGFVKFDLLGLGMLTMLGKALRYVRETRGVALDLASIPPDDPDVYDMICAADTIGVFQIESRAQMNTLPRLKPRCFYDLVVEVALIRPGPIQGDMVHPYLRRRKGEEPVTYLDPRLEPILKRTLGVPLFQEQGMKVAIALAGFTPAQADNMRRAMGFKRSHRAMQAVERDLIAGMRANGVAPEVAEKVLQYLTAFANYGFPESHSASFALLVYASSWLKYHYAPEFYAALLNAQPMGFYSPGTIVHDAHLHEVEVRPVDLARSGWDTTLEPGSAAAISGEPALRLGLRLVRGLGAKAREKLQAARADGPFRSVEDVVRRGGLGARELRVLAEAGAFETLWPGRREALWELLRQVRGDAGPLARRPPEGAGPRTEPHAGAGSRSRPMPSMSALERIAADYRCTGLSVTGHPVAHLRPELRRRGALTAEVLKAAVRGDRVSAAGLVICRQRPGPAHGIMFVTLEDETGFSNFVVMPDRRERMRDVLRAPLLLLGGVVQREDGVVNVLVDTAESLDLGGQTLKVRSHDYR
jgi:error-prone DNA polymerase